MNEILRTGDDAINKEVCCQFVNRQIMNKKMFFSDQKKQKLSIFGFVAN